MHQIKIKYILKVYALKYFKSKSIGICGFIELSTKMVSLECSVKLPF